MIKIWAYVTSKEKDKLLCQTIYQSDKKLTKDSFYNALVEICSKLDVPTPVVLDKHINHFFSFNSTRFKDSDFIEGVGFKHLTLEFMPSKESATNKNTK